MPRLTQVLFGNGRRPAVPPVPFQEILPLRLKNRVSGKINRTDVNSCANEIVALLSCFENNDFEESYCKKEIEEYQKCHAAYTTARKNAKMYGVEGTLYPGLKPSEMSYRQVNNLLKKFPQPK